MNSNESIQVFVRCRPLLESEKQLPVPVEVHPEVNKIIVHDIGCNKNAVKTFSFDKVFGPETQQAHIYNGVAAPLIQEVIMGFNCTILAYGQTGTGKTFTIEGNRFSTLDDSVEVHYMAGIIPRSMKHIFQELTQQKCDFEVNVSFLELYNEEIYDLLSKTDDLIKLKLYDSSSPKGSVIIQGLEIKKVKSMQDVYTILDKGCKKRRKAATLLNKTSSRSHTVFTVTVKMKERYTTIEKVKTGKLNLVDLAGSENIGRSGAIDKRAREAGNINQSLLALGRVITALCENAIHIPYRQSKLTRLLRDSLGGQTKTTVIATISPATCHLDETLNTLEYALRAKNIMNKPEVNSQVSATDLTKDYLEKISVLEKQILELSTSEQIQIHPDNLEFLETAIAEKTKEKWEELEKIEDLNKESQELDEAILKARENLRLKELEWNRIISERNEIGERTEKVQEEIRSEEVEIAILEPVMNKMHEKLHKVLEEKEEIIKEVKKMEEKTSQAVNENCKLQQKVSEMSQSQSNFNQALQQFKDRLLSNLSGAQLNITNNSAECERYLSAFENGFDSFIGSSDKFCQLINSMEDLKKIKNTFQDALVNALKEEESKVNECQSEIKTFISSANLCNFEPLHPLLATCEGNLQGLLISLNQWKDDLMQLVTDWNSSLNNYFSTEETFLTTLTESCEDVANKQNVVMQEYSDIIDGAFQAETQTKQVWDEKISKLEEVVEDAVEYFLQNIHYDIHRNVMAHDKLRIIAENGKQNADLIAKFCKSAMNSKEAFQRDLMLSSSENLCNKMDDMRDSANKVISNYKNFIPSSTRCVKETKTSDEFWEAVKKRVADAKSRRKELPVVASAMQNLQENFVSKKEICSATVAEYQTHLDNIKNNQDAALKNAKESYQRLHDSFSKSISENFRIADNTGFNWGKPEINDIPDGPSNTNLLSVEGASSTLDVTFTLEEGMKAESDTDCTFCKTNDGKETIWSTVFMNPVKQSPGGKPSNTTLTNKSLTSKASKSSKIKKENLQQDQIEKLCQYLMNDSCEVKSAENEKSDTTV